MIKYLDSVIEGMNTDGFAVSILSPLSLEVAAGTVTHTRTSKETGEEETRKKSFPAFTFDVEADPDFAAVYDVYLMDDETIHVDRTVMAPGIMAAYEGTGTLLHMLFSFTLPPNATDLNTIDIEVRTMKGAPAE